MNSIDLQCLINDQGRLAVHAIPRNVYTHYVNEYRRQDAVIREIFAAYYFDFDLDLKLDEAVVAGHEIDVATAAQLILDEMDDGDWWRVMEAFEEHAISHFADDPDRWSSIFEDVTIPKQAAIRSDDRSGST